MPLLAFLYLYPLNQYPHWKDTNACTRVYQALALADDGTLAIDGPLARHGDTEDKAEHEGKHYPDKPPGVSFWLYPFAELVPAEDFDTRFLWLRILGISLPSVLFWWGTWPRWLEWAGDAARATAVVLVGALGTGWWAYSTAAYSHVPAGILLFLAFLAARRGRGFLAGLLCGAAFLCDFVVVLAVPVLGLSTFLRSRRGGALWLAGLLPPLAVWMLYNAACFGGPLQVGFLEHADPRYAAAYGRGFLGMQVPEVAALPGLTFSAARGLFFFSPALLLAPLGWRRLREDRWVCAAVCFAIFAFTLTTVDWRAGWAYGPRYLLPMVPFLLVGVAAALREVAWDHPRALFLGGAGLLGVLASALAMATTPLLVQQFRNPLVSLCARTLLEGHLAPSVASPVWGAWSWLPIGMAVAWVGTRLIRSWKALAVLALLAAGAAMIPEPAADGRAQEIERAELLIRMGRADAAREKLEGLR